jgi:type I restriction enzyme, R subunit
MNLSDTSEKELGQLIVRHLAGISEDTTEVANTVQQSQVVYALGGYVTGRASEEDRYERGVFPCSR